MTHTDPTFDIIITCADGLEAPLLTELQSFGLTATLLRTGRIALAATLEQIYHICLYSRVASRVLLPLGEYHFKHKQGADGKKAIDEDVAECLYRFAKRFDWTTLFGVDNTFAIRLSVDKRVAVNQQFATLRVKDAIADVFNEKFGARPNVDKTPQFTIMVHIGAECAEMALDLSGTSLHRRGYRVANTAAPLKENLACALLYECGWHNTNFNTLIDPMCGSGTLITEALLMRANYPVGLDKAESEFGFYYWAHHDETMWQRMILQAEQIFYANIDTLVHNPLTIIALDADASAIKACHKNILASALAPLAPAITLSAKPVAKLKDSLQSLPQEAHVLLITNPPYGERLGDESSIKALYQGLGLIAKEGLAHVAHATLAVLGAKVEDVDTLPITTPKTLRCHNGALTVYFRHGVLNQQRQSSLIERFEKQEIIVEGAQDFVNRLQKNLSNLKKHAKKQHVTNLRIYDADLPDFNMAIDIYGDKVHVQEYAPPKQIDPEVAKRRFALALSAIRQVLMVNREAVFIKTRARQVGNEQYTRQTGSGKFYVVKEHGAYLYANFTDYLDTGLFIDHRLMRQRVAAASHNKHVLNLFAYTCTASVHAALNGAKTVTSVDLSANYLNWGRLNFALNGLVVDAYFEGNLKYQFVDADVFDWIKSHTGQYEVIFIDPPTFSNSKKFKGTFDVQRDHAALINRAMNRLSHDGVLYFSNNYTRFELDESLKQRYEVIEITHHTIGFDFNPKKPIHQSFEIRHKHAIATAAPKEDGTKADIKNTHAKPKAKQTAGKSFVKSKSINESDNASQGNKGNKGNKSAFARDKKRFDNTRPAWDKKSSPAKQTDINKAAQKPSVKRIFVNPKLANSEEIAKHLEDKLTEVLDERADSTTRYRIKRKN
ncbi:MAG: bifunctional 23S rRNA (guanine(2069)-N(7))-methyltransferase RlmK/23S rRNA (guanine(2445)-N(2))-methyltransferase RlmL [Moraxella sp.]|nr:bifunctional 23S rRNA (guanine(2069)-N(7))-methyltransferase RlmK/23S rRNA (guanine(2445)-N(2))-methyltransferase RlmL [Moraxella sp.]